MIDWITEKLPAKANKRLLPLYIGLNRFAGTNEFRYDIGGKTCSFRYQTRYQFLAFRDLVANGKINLENIQISVVQEIRNCDSFIDIGAYHGLYSVLADQISSTIEICAFEPVDYNRKALSETLQYNDVEAEIREEVVSDFSGNITFFERENVSSQGHSTSAQSGSSETMKKSVSVREFIESRGFSRPYLKIDAEGEEYNIVRDITQLSGVDSARGMVEIHPDKLDVSESEVIGALESNSFYVKSLGNTTESSHNPRPAYYFYKIY